MPLRAITLDVGGTLIEPRPSVGHVYAEVAASFGIEAAPEILTDAFGCAWSSHPQFDYSAQAWRQVVDRSFAQAGHVLPEGCFEAIYARFAKPDAWHVFAEVRPLLAMFQRRRIPVAFVSNWDERLRPLLDALNLSDLAAAVVVSHEMGHRKPAPEIFQHAVEQLGFPPGEVLHVGDSRREDYLGAKGAGLEARWLRRAHVPGPEQIQSLQEILQLLDQPS